ncbi:MAG: patatin-like phospholipase family protein, partial [Candidatus Dormibacteraeota bacterium]|nr:patatin-like phospholipase family protein [Candidatus Dormibacteraeota bacterium]
WVLGGGAARGAAQVGVLRALLEAGIQPPDRIIGVSVGALNGLVLACHPSLAGVHMLEATWSSRLAADVFRARPVESLLTRLGGTGGLSLLPPTALSRLVRRQLTMLGVSRFEDLSVPFQVVVTSLGDGQAHLLERGELYPALVASSAIPGVFPGAEVAGERYYDGGVADNDPLVRAVEQGADEVLAITLCGTSGGTPRPRRWLELLGQSVAVMLNQRMLADFDRVRARARVVVFAPQLPPGSAWSLRADDVARLVARTREAAARWLDEQGGPPRESMVVRLSVAAGPELGAP